MTPRVRVATAADLPAIVDLLREDILGRRRETDDPAPYARAFARIEDRAGDALYVAVDGDDAVIGCFQMTILFCLSRRGAIRAQIESVRVSPDRRGAGVGAAMMAFAEAEARRAGCALIQLTTDAARPDAHRFYERLGYTASHQGMKKLL